MNIVFDCDALLEKFEFLGKDKGFLKQKITRAILKPIKKRARQNIRTLFKRVTGRSAHNTDIWAFKDGSGRLFLGSFYARLMEGDHFIRPKNKEFLRFKVGNKWLQTKEPIFVKKRDVTETIWREGTAGAVMVHVADEVLQAELDKWSAK